MSETLAPVSLLPEGSVVIETFSFKDTRYQAELNILPDEAGALCALTMPLGGLLPSNLGDERHLVFGEYYYDALKIRSNLLNDQLSPLLHSLGYRAYSSELNPYGPHEVTITPMASHLNARLRTLYASTAVLPPFQFVEKEGSWGHATGVEYITNLADGKVVMSTPYGVDYSHDVTAHCVGYCTIDVPTFKIICERAKQLKVEERLGINEAGELVDPVAKEFASAVDSLSSVLYSGDFISDISKVRGFLYALLYGRVFSNRAAEIKVLYDGLKEHRQWLNQRAMELSLAA